MKKLLILLFLLSFSAVKAMEAPVVQLQKLDWSIDRNKLQEALNCIAEAPDLKDMVKKFELEERIGVILVSWEFDPNNSDVYKLRRYALDKLTFAIEQAITTCQGALDQAITGNKTPVINMLRRLLLRAFLEDFNPSIQFEWCHCIDWQKRITLIVQLIHDIKEKYTNPAEQLVYTSFAAGGMLQDVLLLEELIQQGYRNIVVNLVDLGYPDPFTLRELLAQFPEDEQSREHFLYFFKLSGMEADLRVSEQEGDIAKGKDYYTALNSLRIERLKRDLNSRSEFGQVSVNFYNSAIDYLARVQRYSNEKSNVLVMVDPDIYFFEISAYPSLGNVMGINITGMGKENKEPDFYIFMPKNRPVQIYMSQMSRAKQLMGIATAEEQAKDMLRNKVKNKLIALAQQTGAWRQYSSLFRNQILSEFGSYNKNVIEELLNDMYYSLTRYATQTSEISDNEGKIHNLLKEVLGTLELIRSKKLIDTINVEIDTITRMNTVSNPDLGTVKQAAMIVDTVKRKLRGSNSGISYEIKWYTDPHLVFQDFVLNATKPGAIIYELYKVDPISEKAEIVHIDPKAYLTEDVISNNLGRYLTERESIEEEEEYEEEMESEGPNYIKVDLYNPLSM